MVLSDLKQGDVEWQNEKNIDWMNWELNPKKNLIIFVSLRFLRGEISEVLVNNLNVVIMSNDSDDISYDRSRLVIRRIQFLENGFRYP